MPAPKVTYDTTLDESFILRKLILLLDQQPSTHESFIQPPIDEEEKIDSCCFLWDLSISADHSRFLFQHHAVPLLFSIVADPVRNSDRLLVTTSLVYFLA